MNIFHFVAVRILSFLVVVLVDMIRNETEMKPGVHYRVITENEGVRVISKTGLLLVLIHRDGGKKTFTLICPPFGAFVPKGAKYLVVSVN